MPKIQWSHLPPALRDHLFDRVRRGSQYGCPKDCFAATPAQYSHR